MMHARPRSTPRKGRMALLALLGLTVTVTGLAQDVSAQDIQPTDVYYLALSIDESITRQAGIGSDYDKEPITVNAKPRNVFQRAIALAQEYTVLHPGAISSAALASARSRDASQVRPADVFAVLQLVKRDLEGRGAWAETGASRSTKTPSEVYQMLRQISFHFSEIAQERGIETDWATPARVYEANLAEVMPLLYGIARQQGMDLELFGFPPNPVAEIRPRHIYVLQMLIYRTVAAHFAASGYEPLELTNPQDVDGLDPGDVFDLTQILIGELRALHPSTAQLDPEVQDRYEAWLATKETVRPGDVYHLVQHNLGIVRRLQSADEN